MKQATVEFHRPVEALRIPPAGSTDKLAATPKECAAVAKRLMLPAIHSLSAVLDVSHWREGGLQVRGQVVSELDQVCVVTLEPFRSLVTKPVDRFFLPPAVLKEIGEEEADVEALEDGKADLGELVVETLALELDPYPRKPGAVFEPVLESADEPEATVSPFAKLAKLAKPDEP